MEQANQVVPAPKAIPFNALRFPSLNSDPRYIKLCIEYADDWGEAMAYFFGKYPDYQQMEVIDELSKKSARVSVKSGHGTGKSDLMSMTIIMFMIFHPQSIVTVVAAKIQVVKEAIWKNLEHNFKQLKKRVPWVAKYFELTDSRFYEKSSKAGWSCVCKGYQNGNEQSLAGTHENFSLTIVDEASILTDAAFGVLLGALTEYDNRIIATSQPTRSAGFFYDTHNRLSHLRGGRWRSITLRSDMSKFVEPDFIRDCLMDFGGYDSPDFQIKVLGEFPKKLKEFLLSRTETELAVHRRVDLDEDWGWVACIDVGISRDRSVINIMKVSGKIGTTRKVQTYKVLEMEADYGAPAFARRILAECCTGLYPNITLAIDCDGVGMVVTQFLRESLKEQNINARIQEIRWGKRPFTTQLKSRFLNLRAMATVYLGDSIKSGRMSIDSDDKTLDQVSRLPVSLNGSGQWVVMKKEDMKKRLNLASPDRADTLAFSQLVNYMPAGSEDDELLNAELDEMGNWLAADGIEDEDEDSLHSGFDIIDYEDLQGDDDLERLELIEYGKDYVDQRRLEGAYGEVEV